jgi:hypothetical protein
MDEAEGCCSSTGVDTFESAWRIITISWARSEEQREKEEISRSVSWMVVIEQPHLATHRAEFSTRMPELGQQSNLVSAPVRDTKWRDDLAKFSKHIPVHVLKHSPQWKVEEANVLIVSCRKVKNLPAEVNERDAKLFTSTRRPIVSI